MLLEISADPGSELMLVIGVGTQVSGSEIDVVLVSNGGWLESTTLGTVAPSVRSIRGVGN